MTTADVRRDRLSENYRDYVSIRNRCQPQKNSEKYVCPGKMSSTYKEYLRSTVLVRSVKLETRNRETRMWGLVAKRDIKTGELVGIYTGSHDSLTCPPNSRYAVDIGTSQPCIIPFADENAITPFQRDTHPLACMNEPNQGRVANCHMAIQDFARHEVEGVASIPHNDEASFFRCLACFACEDIKRGDPLTWYYGKSYEPIRAVLGYTAGEICTRVQEGDVFIASDSQATLDALSGRVPHYTVFPILRSQMIKSARFKKKKRHSVDSEGEASESFSSGSEGEREVYHRRGTARTRKKPSQSEAQTSSQSSSKSL